MKIHFFRSVWEDTIILQDNDSAAFIDTGLESRFLEIPPYLEALGIRHIEFILLTVLRAGKAHYFSDGMKGGFHFENTIMPCISVHGMI